MNKRHITLLLGIIILAILFCGCSAIFKEPTVKVEDIELTNINATDLEMEITLLIDNPNPFGVMFEKITADVSYPKDDEWIPLSHIEKENVDIIPGKSTVVLPVSAKNMDLIKAGFTMLKAREITIKVTGVAQPSFFGITPEIPFSETKTIPLKI